MMGTKTTLKIAKMLWEKSFVNLSFPLDVLAPTVCLTLACTFPNQGSPLGEG